MSLIGSWKKWKFVRRFYIIFTQVSHQDRQFGCLKHTLSHEYTPDVYVCKKNEELFYRNRTPTTLHHDPDMVIANSSTSSALLYT